MQDVDPPVRPVVPIQMTDLITFCLLGVELRCVSAFNAKVTKDTKATKDSGSGPSASSPPQQR